MKLQNMIQATLVAIALTVPLMTGASESQGTVAMTSVEMTTTQMVVPLTSRPVPLSESELIEKKRLTLLKSLINRCEPYPKCA